MWYGVTVKVLVVFCIGLALVTTLFGALRGMAAENKNRDVQVTEKLAEKTTKVDSKGKLGVSEHNQTLQYQSPHQFL